MKQTAENEAIFATMPPAKALLKLAVPTIISQMVALVYNLADTFFVSQLGTAQGGAVGIVFSIMACTWFSFVALAMMK